MARRQSPLDRDTFVAPPDPPDDVVEGRDPAFIPTFTVVQATEALCLCGYRIVGDKDDVERRMGKHLDFGHRAYRNPEIACQAVPMWDNERWCMRPTNHEGPHWTPDGSHQGRWWRNG